NGFTPLGPSSAIAAMVRGMGEALVIGDDELATPASARQAFAEAGADVTTAVCVSSAMVYGAWPDNPVPLTEDAPVRPNPGFDVAPSGWIAGEEVEALRGDRRRVRVPARVFRMLTRTFSRPGTTSSAAVVPYLVHPWVVANDRLVRAGWRPRHSNHEVLVAA